MYCSYFCIGSFIHVASDQSTTKTKDRSKSPPDTSIHDTSTFMTADKISEQNQQGESSPGASTFVLCHV